MPIVERGLAIADASLVSVFIFLPAFCGLQPPLSPPPHPRRCRCLFYLNEHASFHPEHPHPGTTMPPALEGDNNTAVSLDTLNEGQLREISRFLPLRDLFRPLFIFSLPLLFRPPVPDPSSSASHASSFLFRSRHASRVRFRPPCIWRDVVTVVSEIILDTHGSAIIPAFHSPRLSRPFFFGVRDIHFVCLRTAQWANRAVEVTRASSKGRELILARRLSDNMIRG